MSGFRRDPGNIIKASSEDIKKHVERLLKRSYRQLLEDVVRDPSDSNVAIVSIVADMRLARMTKWTLVGTWAAVAMGLGAVLIAVANLH